jgi:hypothetical protein
MLTRLGEAGGDAFIMRIAGHSSIAISQRSVHPSPESVERAFARLEASGQTALRTGGGIGAGPEANPVRRIRKQHF